MYELRDGELGLTLGSYESEVEALEAVRALCSGSRGSTAPLGLVRDGRELVASGDDLVRRARLLEP
jgi:hypothetical protein